MFTVKRRILFAVSSILVLLVASMPSIANAGQALLDIDSKDFNVSLNWEGPLCFSFQRTWNPETHQYDGADGEFQSDPVEMTLTCCGTVQNPTYVTITYISTSNSNFYGAFTYTGLTAVEYQTSENQIIIKIMEEGEYSFALQLVGKEGAQIDFSKMEIGRLNLLVQSESSEQEDSCADVSENLVISANEVEELTISANEVEEEEIEISEDKIEEEEIELSGDKIEEEVEIFENAFEEEEIEILENKIEEEEMPEIEIVKEQIDENT